MKPRTIVISAAAVVLAGGALISAMQGPQPCEVTAQGVSIDNGREKLVGTASCETGAVLVTLGDATGELSVRNHAFGAWVETRDGKPVSLQDVRPPH